MTRPSFPDRESTFETFARHVSRGRVVDLLGNFIKLPGPVERHV